MFQVAFLFISCSASGRNIILTIHKEARQEETEIDGCYGLETDLTIDSISKETVHTRYRDLGLVERAFRTGKTVELEIHAILTLFDVQSPMVFKTASMAALSVLSLMGIRLFSGVTSRESAGC